MHLQLLYDTRESPFRGFSRTPQPTFPSWLQTWSWVVCTCGAFVNFFWISLQSLSHIYNAKLYLYMGAHPCKPVNMPSIKSAHLWVHYYWDQPVVTCQFLWYFWSIVMTTVWECGALMTLWMTTNICQVVISTVYSVCGVGDCKVLYKHMTVIKPAMSLELR